MILDIEIDLCALQTWRVMGAKRVTRHENEALKGKWIVRDQGNKPKEQEVEPRLSGEDPLGHDRVGMTLPWFFGHKSLIRAPIEVIQNFMKR